MSPVFRASARHWLAGLALAAAGVALARLVAPGFADRARAAVALSGELLALAGLFVIAHGIRRRLRHAGSTPDGPAPASAPRRSSAQ